MQEQPTPSQNLPATVQSTQLAESAKYRSIARLEDITQFSAVLKKYIQENNLTTKIGDKEWVNFEGWQFAGAAFGIGCYTKGCVRVNTGDATEIMYMAEVALRNLVTGAEIANVMVPCSNKEPGKKGYAAFAIASMAQTRAGSKAFRSQIAFIMKSAGFEVTPAEEMDSLHAEQEQEARVIKLFEEKLTQAENRNDLTQIYRDPLFEKYKNNSLFALCLKLRTRQFEIEESLDKVEAKLEEAIGKVNGMMSGEIYEEAQIVNDDFIEAQKRFEQENNPSGSNSSEPMATVKQRAELLMLIQSDVFTKEEKNKMVNNVNSLTQAKATEWIEKLKKTIQKRNNGTAA